MIEALERHYPKLSVLNLAKNKLGFEGAKNLAEAMKNMKLLTSLDLSENDIGDLGVVEIVKTAKAYGSLE